MNILDTIIARKQEEVSERKLRLPVSFLEKTPGFKRETISMAASLKQPGSTGIIAEFKRRSPSKGLINGTADVMEVTAGYTRYGAAGLSVLTDADFFGGDEADLVLARGNQIPILRKDFVVDEYQILEARSIGADLILLIAACLTPVAVQKLARTARDLGLEVLLELHAEEELGHICPETNLIGINNRDLKSFAVDIERSLRMAEKLGKDRVKIAESGIDDPARIKVFRNHGFDGFLIGENFMKNTDPVKAFQKFVDAL